MNWSKKIKGCSLPLLKHTSDYKINSPLNQLIIKAAISSYTKQDEEELLELISDDNRKANFIYSAFKILSEVKKDIVNINLNSEHSTEIKILTAENILKYYKTEIQKNSALEILQELIESKDKEVQTKTINALRNIFKFTPPDYGDKPVHKWQQFLKDFGQSAEININSSCKLENKILCSFYNKNELREIDSSGKTIRKMNDNAFSITPLKNGNRLVLNGNSMISGVSRFTTHSSKNNNWRSIYGTTYVYCIKSIFNYEALFILVKYQNTLYVSK